MAALVVILSPLPNLRGLLRRCWGQLGGHSPPWGKSLCVNPPCPRDGLAGSRNIDVCPQCGNLKQKHILCGYCYEKVKQETTAIRKQIWAQEGGPHKAPVVETVVLYEGEKPREQDKGKRIVERNRKRPSWFTLD
ncbi:hypothetical protein lerEdw1_012923 [Lerista edwardsae]|nr:hypothetical protein lerEdw1_012923 [Lerista edwardsae]